MQALQPALHDVALDDLILKYTELALSWHADEIGFVPSSLPDLL